MYTYTILLINKTNSFYYNYNINTIDGMLIMFVNVNYNNSVT